MIAQPLTLFAKAGVARKGCANMKPIFAGNAGSVNEYRHRLPKQRPTVLLFFAIIGKLKKSDSWHSMIGFPAEVACN
jgi:hypothetical protein